MKSSKGNNEKKVLSWFSLIWSLAIIIGTFSTFISLCNFYIHLDDHMSICQQQGHHMNCHASCVLKDLMQTSPNEDAPIPYFHTTNTYFIFLVYFAESSIYHQDLSAQDIYSSGIMHYAKCYISPSLGSLTPPPKS